MADLRQTDAQAPASRLASVRETRAALERHGLYTKHRLGQNFLVDDSVIGRILGLAELCCDDCVLEVGPGIGTLTVALLPRVARVVAVEADRTLAPVLDETCAQDSEKFQLVWGDALRAVPDRLPDGGAGITKFVSNLPYQIAATVILQAFERMPSLQRAVVMVQAEVADRIAAAPGSRDFGAYTAKLSLYGKVTGRFEVGRGCFMPAPHVESAVVRIDRGGIACDHAAVCQVIDAAFAQRRKTIRNSMAAKGFDKGALDAAFAATGISPSCRAETLASADFVRLAQALEAGA